MAEKQVTERVPMKEKLGFMSFSTATNTCFNLKSLYYMTFLKMILKIPVTTAALIVTIGTIWDAINDPLIGFWSVNHRFKSGEKIRPLTLWFAVPFAISVVLMFTDFHLSQTWTVIVCILIYIVFEACYTFLCIPYNSMGALATDNDEDRRSINSFRSLGGCLGSGIGAVLTTPLVKAFGGLKSDIYTSDDAKALFWAAVVMGGVIVVGCAIHYFTSKERVSQSSDNEDKIGFVETFKMLFSIKTWVANMVFILCYGIITALIMNEVNDYAAYVLHNSSMATPILAFYLVISIITSLGIGVLDRKVGHRKTMIIGALVQIVGRIPFFIAPYSLVSVVILAIAQGLGGSIAFIMFNTNRNNLADIVEFKFNRRIDSMVSTCDNLISKLAEAISIWLMGLALGAAGYNEALGINQPTSAITTIILLIGLVPAILSVIQILAANKADVQKEYAEEKANYEARIKAE